jgi:hypothetical protein
MKINGEYIYLLVLHLSMVGAILWAVRAEKKVSVMEGHEQVYKWAQESEDHACGPYEQPVHPNFTRKAKL